MSCKVYKDYPSTSTLLKLVKSIGYRQTARLVGVSDNAIRFHLKRNAVPLPQVSKGSKSNRKGQEEIVICGDGVLYKVLV